MGNQALVLIPQYFRGLQAVNLADIRSWRYSDVQSIELAKTRLQSL
jgi:hypothetical protein